MAFRLRRLAFLVSGFLLAACAAAPPAFSSPPAPANHALSCAIAIAWDDCLPGTSGHARYIHPHSGDLDPWPESQSAVCGSRYDTPALDPIRSKVELVRNAVDAPAPQTLADTSFPLAEEQKAIALWAEIRAGCIQNPETRRRIPGPITAAERENYQQGARFNNAAIKQVSYLIAALSQAKLTYSEFAKMRFQVGNDFTEAVIRYQEAVLIVDEGKRAAGIKAALYHLGDLEFAWQLNLAAIDRRMSH